MPEPLVPPTAWEMMRAVYANRLFLVEELCGWATFLSGFLMGIGAQQPLIGLVLMAAGLGLSYHAHRRAFLHLVAVRMREAEERAGES